MNIATTNKVKEHASTKYLLLKGSIVYILKKVEYKINMK